MCHYIRLSGGQHGFADISVREAVVAGNELNAVKEVVARVSRPMGGIEVFSISYFDENDKEVLHYSLGMRTARVFDPPRSVAPMFLINHTI